jgi:16S rRNA (cytidine1402-2'-O)-methyltransferase
MRTVVCFEAPHRLLESLRDIHELLGDREVVVAREVSKIYEEFLRGLAGELIDKLAGREIRGEVTLVIKGSAGESPISEALLRAEIRKLKGDGMRVKEIAELLGERYGYSKKEIYRLALEQ